MYKKFVFQFLSIKTLLALFFVSHVSMKYEYSFVKSFFRQFSVGFTYFHSVSCFVKLDPNFSICITLLQTIINVYYCKSQIGCVFFVLFCSISVEFKTCLHILSTVHCVQ